MNSLPQAPISPKGDLRDMLRKHLVERSLAYMEDSVARRKETLNNGNIHDYCQTIAQSVVQFHGELPAGPGKLPPKITEISRFDKKGYRIENILFDSFPGWQVNATVYVPLYFKPPFPAVVVPVGHSGKQFVNYQLPCQYFARAGYLAITFDPPGQASEKQPGNDHFLDGVRCYSIGETSHRYFVTDAIRCIDYLETRKDVDRTNGYAMTGVSGGGTTTIFTTYLDQRISVLGPSCCLSPLSGLRISQCYAACPEGSMWRRFAEGIDYIDLVAAALPKPMLLMAGEKDEVYQIEPTRILAEEAAQFYEKAGHADRFQFFADKSGHAYTLEQAREFTKFMGKWLNPSGNLALPDITSPDFVLNPYEEMRCYPDTAVNIRSITYDRFNELKPAYSKDAQDIQKAATDLVAYDFPQEEVSARITEPFQIWVHDWQQVLLESEADIELPATFVSARNGKPGPILLHFDDKGRDRLLAHQGILAEAIDLLNRDIQVGNVFTVDLRGWGDSSPALYPYEIPSWGGQDRFFAYATAALGDSIMAMRIRDGLRTLAYVRSLSHCQEGQVVISGCGLGGMVAQHVATIDGNTSGLITWESLYSLETLLAAEQYDWPADTFVPNILLQYDLPDLTSSLSCPVRILLPLDAMRDTFSDEILETRQKSSPSNVRIYNSEDAGIISEIQSLITYT